METFLLVFAALFSVINPPGTGLVFLSMTKYASTATQTGGTEFFFVMTGSLLIGALVLKSMAFRCWCFGSPAV
jgi:small neutral amino acid transporter SnatA (MarC family)